MVLRTADKSKAMLRSDMGTKGRGYMYTSLISLPTQAFDFIVH